MFLLPKLRYLGSDKGMTCLHKLRHTYMLTAPNTKEVHSEQKCDKHDDVPQLRLET